MLPGIELHHEALDGRGYPYGLQGDQIPLLARVIAVADTFDALTTNRPYQQAHSPEEAIRIIQNLAGKRLDPAAVAALLAVYERGEIRLQRFSIKRPVTAASVAAAGSQPPPEVSAGPASVSLAAGAAELENSRTKSHAAKKRPRPSSRYNPSCPSMIQTLFGSLEEEKKTGFFDRMKQAVTRTRENLAERIEEVVSFSKEIDSNTLDDLESTLIGADLGTATTQEVLSHLRDKADRKQIKDTQELKRLLKEELLAILNKSNSQAPQRVDGIPEVILVVGVNGTGKTTTIGKLSQVFRSQGKNVLLCAADTFRAAAIDQLEIWGQRTGTEVIKTKPGGDPAAVLFDALQAARRVRPTM